MNRRSFRFAFLRAASMLGALCLAVPALAQIPVTVNLNLIELFERTCSEGPPEVCPNDMYIRVNIGSNIPGNDFVRYDFPDNVGNPHPPVVPVASRVIMLNGSDGNITVDIEVWDRDDAPGSDDRMPIDGGFTALRVRYDLTAGGESEYAASGTGDNSVSIRFKISSEGNDVDGDGIPDNLEAFGIRDAGGNLIADLAAMGANPRRKDVFVEIDCMVSDGNGNGYNPLDPADHSHCPAEAAMADVVQAFANAPVPNLDGTQGVQLHLDVGRLYGAGRVVPVPGAGGAAGSYGDFGSGGTPIPEAGNTIIDWDGPTGNPATSFYSLKAAPNNFFNAGRALAFRYAIFGHQTNLRAAANDCTSGWAEDIPGNDFMITLGGVNAAGARCWTRDANGFSVGSRGEQAGTFMHELGHVLGLRHGGSDEINNKPNYLSVMNYTFQPCMVPASAAAGVPGACDYSRIGPQPGGMNDLNETSLDECAGVGGGLGFGSVNWNGDRVFPGGPALFQGATCAAPNNGSNAVADVNNDGVCITFGPNGAQDSAVVLDDNLTCPSFLCPGPGNPGSINDGPNRICNSQAAADDVQLASVGTTPGQPDLLKSFNDWGGLVFGFRDHPSFSDGVASPVKNEADPDAIRLAREYLAQVAGPDMKLTKSGPATILPGQTVTWTTELGNPGNGPALLVVLTDTAPGAAPFVQNLGTQAAGAAFTRSAQYRVPAGACPMDLVSEAQVSYRDLAAGTFTRTARAVTRVLDIVPPTLTLALSQNALWPPNHKLATLSASITVTDNCDPNPRVRLVSITSDEADNGLGDGDTANDIQGAAYGTDDRSFQLRAERSGRGTGRIYTITYEASDASGNRTTQQATVTVPQSN
ncbi:MAG TPA: hypothetical protein VEF92_05110 [Burkholderiales bacterium]|nr:hypothetical protein [Burkholderiales bacterium]